MTMVGRSEEPGHSHRIISDELHPSVLINITNEHVKSSTNVATYEASFGTCCGKKPSHTSGARSHYYQHSPSSARLPYPVPLFDPHQHHIEQHELALSGNRPARIKCDRHDARDNHSKRSSLLCSSSEFERDLSRATITKSSRSRRNGVVFSQLLFLLALALVNCFNCWPMIVRSSLAAPTERDGVRLEGATLRAEDVLPMPHGGESWRARVESMRDLRAAREPSPEDKPKVNMSNVFEYIFKKRPYSKYWTVEQKWDDLFKRLINVQGTVRQMVMRSFMRDIEYYADLSISDQCEQDLKFIQSYAKQSTNMRWLAHMFDATAKSESGMLTGMLAHMGHPIQCIKVRAPARPSNHSLEERFFEHQTRLLGERFRGKYCLASMRPVLPKRPRLISRFSRLMNASLLSNVSYLGEPLKSLKLRARQMFVPERDQLFIERRLSRLDQVPFESELYEYLIAQRNFMFTLPRIMGVCYPSSCTREDVRASLQKTLDEQHQVVDIEFECEQEETNAWDWFSTPRLVAYVLLVLIAVTVFSASLMRYILLSKMQIRRAHLEPTSRLAQLLRVLDGLSMDKCTGIVFIKTKPGTSEVDWTKVENNRSTAIDALKGFLMLVLVYSQLTLLGCLPVPFMWSKWSDAMFPFFRSLTTQLFINVSLWSEAFYIISAYLIALKCFENFRPKLAANTFASSEARWRLPEVFSFAAKRYIRLLMPMIAFILLNYVWPRLSHGFVFQDQASRLMKPCDTGGWTNMMLFHNHFPTNETCLWPSHVSATFFQLHLLSYPLIALCLVSMWLQFNVQHDNQRKFLVKLLGLVAFGLMAALGLSSAVYAAWEASRNELIVPFLIDYIDYDNYRRVIEWMVMPTYNHLTSYVVGLALAFIVVQRKARNESRQFQSKCATFNETETVTQLNQFEGSVNFVKSASAQELRVDGTFDSPLGLKQFNVSLGASSSCASSNQDDAGLVVKTDASLTRRSDRPKFIWVLLKSSLALGVLSASLLASWLWNGLGQPMSAEQTFWYVLTSKLCFCLSFAYLFHEHFATRRNSSNPWMITRLLVPIGRMSLTVFYVSWLVIWFDLLSSPYQWHPSHYFVFEKYNEIIFITMILSMFAYAVFEGVIKRAQYISREERVNQDKLSSENRPENSMAKLGNSSSLYAADIKLQSTMTTNCHSWSRVKPFESFFDALDKTTTNGKANEEPERRQPESSARVNDTAIDSRNTNSALDGQESTKDNRPRQRQPDKPLISSRVLSPRELHVLNAELRANSSFASISLYERAGATSDLPDPNSPVVNQKSAKNLNR